jgi:formamidopyrimidine-DNA glycosylase
MPELPEVETMRLQLKKFLTGHVIKDIKIFSEKILSGDTKNIIGGKIKDVRRFGKVSVIDFSNGYSLITHVKLTGQYIYQGPNLTTNNYSLSSKVIGGVPGPHTLVIFDLDRGGVLYYNDVRRFGWIKIVKRQEVNDERFISKLGKDALEISLEELQNIFSKSSRAVKVVLMDQTKIGGVGNIYANDALWLSSIDPKRKANSLEEKTVEELYKAIITVLKAGLKYGGASELAFVTPDGKEGEYQNHTLAYGHDGEPCERPACRQAGVRIEKYFLGGRGTYWCPVCQK